MEAERPPARAVTQRKTVTFVRHGVAAHNFHGVQDPHPDEPARYTDSPLTDYGRAQAAAAATITPALGCELLVCAPLSRAIETGLLAFPDAPRIVAHEAVREYAARRYANKRKTRTELAAAFDRVDFSLVESDPDPLFNPDQAEPWPAGPIARAKEFMGWVLQQPERQIAVASHGVFIEVLLRLFSALPEDERVMNCELRTMVVQPSEGGMPCEMVELLPTMEPPEAAVKKECRERGVERQ